MKTEDRIKWLEIRRDRMLAKRENHRQLNKYAKKFYEAAKGNRANGIIRMNEARKVIWLLLHQNEEKTIRFLLPDMHGNFGYPTEFLRKESLAILKIERSIKRLQEAYEADFKQVDPLRPAYDIVENDSFSSYA